jgi:hypothetical protein
MRQIMRPSIKYFLIYPVLILSLVVALFPANPVRVSAAACTAPTTDYGTVTSSPTSQISIPATGTYRVWSRMQIPNSTSNSYLLEIDGTSCYNVGGNTAMATNTWTWVDYQGGVTTNKINATLSAGNHSYKLIGNAEGVMLDRLIFTQDTTGSNCNPPTGTGDTCANPVDTTPPTVSLTSPAAGASVSGNAVPINATATDGSSSISKVEFYINGGTAKYTDTTAPYSWTWDTTTGAYPNGSYSITAKAYDGATTPNVATSTAVAVTVNNAAAPLPGDTNGSGTVTITDLNAVLNNWSKTGLTRAQGDLTGDGTVTITDLNQVLNNWTR